MAYETDILDEFESMRRRPRYPGVTVEIGMLVEDRSSGFCGDVVRWNAEGITVQDRNDHVRHFTWKPGGFLIEGRAVTLVRPAGVREVTQRITASGSIATTARPQVARASRIWVEGRHDAELVEHVWGDDLRPLGIVVEPMHGADDLRPAVERFGPGTGRRLGILLDHLVPGSKESRGFWPCLASRKARSTPTTRTPFGWSGGRHCDETWRHAGSRPRCGTRC